MENISLGLTLMVVGMLTVFLILTLVIYLSKLLIIVVNKVAPEEGKAAKKPAAAKVTTVDANTMAVISAAVSQLTGGKGSVAKVERV